MKFYNIDLQGKMFMQRGASDPSTNPSYEGRLFYNSTNEEMKYHDSAGWIKVWSENNLDELATALTSDSTALDNLGVNFLRKDQADSTPFALGVGSLSSSGALQGASLVVTGTSATVNGSQVWTSGNDGAGSGLDADLLDGQNSAYYLSASNLNAGTVPVARLSGTYNISITGTARYA